MGKFVKMSTFLQISRKTRGSRNPETTPEPLQIAEKIQKNLTFQKFGVDIQGDLCIAILDAPDF